MQTNFWRDCTTSLFPPFFTFIFFLSFPFLSSSLYSFWILCLPNLTYSPLLAVSSLSLSLTRMLPRACHVRECACVRLAVSLSPASEGDGTGGDCTFLLMLPGAPSWFRLPTNPFPIHTCVTVICWCCVVLVTGKRGSVSVCVGLGSHRVTRSFFFVCAPTHAKRQRYRVVRHSPSQSVLFLPAVEKRGMRKSIKVSDLSAVWEKFLG